MQWKIYLGLHKLTYKRAANYVVTYIPATLFLAELSEP